MLAAVLALGALAYFASFRPWTRPVLLDAATWDSMAVETARGLVPYRDVFLHKTPGAALLGGAAARAGMAAGLEPVLVAHALFLVVGALGPVLLFLLCRTSLPAGPSLAAAIAMLAFDQWPIAALEGCRPKVPTVAFGLAAMLAAERGRASAAALLGGCSVLFWQPGLAFLVGAWAAVVRREGLSPRRTASMVALSLVPSALLLLWLAASGALVDFVEQAVLFNVDYIGRKARTALGTMQALLRTATDWNDVEMLLAPAALVGLLLRRARPLAEDPGRVPLSLVVSGSVYLAMTFASYQSWPDSILLAPAVATVLGVGLHGLLREGLAPLPATALALVVVALAAVPDSRPKFHPPVDFATQRARFAALDRGLSPDDTVVGVSVPEYFLHTGRRNGWKWPYLWFGVDDFAAARHEGGFDGILADLDRMRPRRILVARLWAGPSREAFERWAAARYDVEAMRLWPHLRKPLRVYRLREEAGSALPKPTGADGKPRPSP